MSDLFKPFEGFQKELGKEIPTFILGIGLDAGKGMGWKGYIFVWPFVAVFAIAALMLLRVILRFIFAFVY